MRAWLLPMVVGACVAAAAGDAPPVDLSESGARGRLKRIVKPDYPAEALARSQGGVITMEGEVDASGYVNEFRYVPDKPESRVFIPALQKVARNWLFSVPTDSECQPIKHVVRTEVSFEVADGNPRIFVTHAAAPSASSPVERRPYFVPAHRVDPAYPLLMQRRGLMSDTFAKIAVDRDGTVLSVTARSYSPQARPEKLVAFDDSTQSSLLQWKFPVVPAQWPAPWFACYEIHFRLP